MASGPSLNVTGPRAALAGDAAQNYNTVRLKYGDAAQHQNTVTLHKTLVTDGAAGAKDCPSKDRRPGRSPQIHNPARDPAATDLAPLSSPSDKNKLLSLLQNLWFDLPVPPRERDVSRSSRTSGAGYDGLSELQRAGRVRTNSSFGTAKSRGPGIPTLMPSSQTMICGRRWPKSPAHRGDRV
jgi:hypothetical protein